MIIRTIPSRLGNEGGFALAAVLFVVALLGVLAVAGLTSTTMRTIRLGRSPAWRIRARYALACGPSLASTVRGMVFTASSSARLGSAIPGRGS